MTTDSEVPDFAAWGPAILIGAGVIGLIATLVNSRRKDDPRSPTAHEPDQRDDSDQTSTEIVSHEEHR